MRAARAAAPAEEVAEALVVVGGEAAVAPAVVRGEAAEAPVVVEGEEAEAAAAVGRAEAVREEVAAARGLEEVVVLVVEEAAGAQEAAAAAATGHPIRTTAGQSLGRLPGLDRDGAGAAAARVASVTVASGRCPPPSPSSRSWRSFSVFSLVV